MLLMVARDTTLALKASGEEGSAGGGVWTGAKSATPFRTLCCGDFSSFWEGEEKIIKAVKVS